MSISVKQFSLNMWTGALPSSQPWPCRPAVAVDLWKDKGVMTEARERHGIVGVWRPGFHPPKNEWQVLN